MSTLAFTFASTTVRVFGTPDAPLFAAVDVCRILEIDNPSDAVRRLDDDERTLVSNEGAPNGLKINVVTEAGLFALILGSRKPQAKEFKRWVTHEVLPSIRKTGRYELAAPVPALPKTFAEALRALADTVEEKDRLALTVAEMEPKAAFADAVQLGVSEMNIGTFGKIIGVKKIYETLVALRYVYRRDGHVVPFAQYDHGGAKLFRVRMVQKGEHVYPITSITGKGQLKIAAELGVTPPLLEMSNIVAMPAN